jgi:hypothetical protein
MDRCPGNRVLMMNWTKEQLSDKLIEQGTRPKAKTGRLNNNKKMLLLFVRRMEKGFGSQIP